jgi:DNA-binding MarR family transcriptional regulator
LKDFIVAIPGALELKSGSSLFESALGKADEHGGFAGPVQTLARAFQRLDASHRRMRRTFATNLGLSASEFNALMLISQIHQLTPKQLASQLGLTNGAVTAMTDRLDADGWIVRTPNPSDRRSLYLEVTPKGAEAVTKVASDYLDMVATAVATSEQLSSADIAELVEHTADVMLAAVDDLDVAAL